MPLLSVEQLRAFVETDMGDDALELLLGDAEAAVIARHGPHAAVTTTVYGDPHLPSPAVLYLDRPIATVTSVTEYDHLNAATILAPTDYDVLYGGRAVSRFTSPYAWAGKVTITYAPQDDTAQRKRVIVDLVKLALSYQGAAKTGAIGAYSYGGSVAPESYVVEREAILSELDRSLAFS